MVENKVMNINLNLCLVRVAMFYIALFTSSLPHLPFHVKKIQQAVVAI